MSVKDKICPKCGRSDKEVKFHGFICVEDYLADKKIKMPSSIEIQVCKYGDKIGINRWEFEQDKLIPQVSRLVKAKGVEILNVSIDLEKETAYVEMSVDSEKIYKEFPIEIKKSLCDVHTKAVRGYFEAIVQIRPSDKLLQRKEEQGKKRDWMMEKLSDRAEQLLKVLHKTDYVKKEKVKGGYDLYVSSASDVFRALGNLGVKGKISRKLWGQKDSRQIYRTTFLVRV